MKFDIYRIEKEINITELEEIKKKEENDVNNKIESHNTENILLEEAQKEKELKEKELKEKELKEKELKEQEKKNEELPSFMKKKLNNSKEISKEKINENNNNGKPLNKSIEKPLEKSNEKPLEKSLESVKMKNTAVENKKMILPNFYSKITSENNLEKEKNLKKNVKFNLQSVIERSEKENLILDSINSNKDKIEDEKVENNTIVDLEKNEKSNEIESKNDLKTVENDQKTTTLEQNIKSKTELDEKKKKKVLVLRNKDDKNKDKRATLNKFGIKPTKSYLAFYIILKILSNYHCFYGICRKTSKPPIKFLSKNIHFFLLTLYFLIYYAISVLLKNANILNYTANSIFSCSFAAVVIVMPLFLILHYVFVKITLSNTFVLNENYNDLVNENDDKSSFLKLSLLNSKVYLENSVLLVFILASASFCVSFYMLSFNKDDIYKSRSIFYFWILCLFFDFVVVRNIYCVILAIIYSIYANHKKIHLNEIIINEIHEDCLELICEEVFFGKKKKENKEKKNEELHSIIDIQPKIDQPEINEKEIKKEEIDNLFEEESPNKGDQLLPQMPKKKGKGKKGKKKANAQNSFRSQTDMDLGSMISNSKKSTKKPKSQYGSPIKKNKKKNNSPLIIKKEKKAQSTDNIKDNESEIKLKSPKKNNYLMKPFGNNNNLAKTKKNIINNTTDSFKKYDKNSFSPNERNMVNNSNNNVNKKKLIGNPRVLKKGSNFNKNNSPKKKNEKEIPMQKEINESIHINESSKLKYDENGEIIKEEIINLSDGNINSSDNEKKNLKIKATAHNFRLNKFTPNKTNTFSNSSKQKKNDKFSKTTGKLKKNWFDDEAIPKEHYKKYGIGNVGRKINRVLKKTNSDLKNENDNDNLSAQSDNNITFSKSKKKIKNYKKSYEMEDLMDEEILESNKKKIPVYDKKWLKKQPTTQEYRKMFKNSPYMEYLPNMLKNTDNYDNENVINKKMLLIESAQKQKMEQKLSKILSTYKVDKGKNMSRTAKLQNKFAIFTSKNIQNNNEEEEEEEEEKNEEDKNREENELDADFT